MVTDPVAVLVTVAKAMDKLQIPYVIGGSMASSMYGVPRSTQDVDLLAFIGMAQADAIADVFKAEFYVSKEMITDAIRRRNCFNIVHLTTMVKVDIFVARNTDWAREEMDPARAVPLLDEYPVRFSSPEDTVLHKLEWYILGGRTSDRQWQDIVGVVRVQGQALDFDYLEKHAGNLGVVDLLKLVRAEIEE